VGLRVVAAGGCRARAPGIIRVAAADARSGVTDARRGLRKLASAPGPTGAPGIPYYRGACHPTTLQACGT